MSDVPSPLDIKRLRADTPGSDQVIHLNNAAAALMARPVLSSMQDYLLLEAETGGAEAVERSLPMIENIYANAARLLNGAPDEIALSTSQSRAAQMALAAIPLHCGDRVLIANSEWGGQHVNLLSRCREAGAELAVIPDDRYGMVDLDRLDSILDERVRMVHLTWLPANNGLIQPAEAIGDLLRGRDVIYSIDAGQAVGQLPVDVKKLNCDILTAPGRKWLRAPRGTGILYIKRTVLEQLTLPLLDVFSAPWREEEARYIPRSDARRFETSERSFLLQIGLSAAIDYALTIGIDRIAATVQERAQQLRAVLADLPDIIVHDRGQRQSGIVTLTHARLPSPLLQQRLRAQGINSSALVPGYTPLDRAPANIAGVLRLAPHYYNTQEEFAILAEQLRRMD